MKQLNLALGGSRNFTHQFKGIETASGGNLDISANHGTWLYYALGKCLTIDSADGDNGGMSADRFAGAADSFLYHSESLETQGPIFYRSIGTIVCPPVSPLDVATLTEVDKLTLPNDNSGAIANAITYTFGESNGALLPSFALEHVYSKLSASDPYKTTATPPSSNDEAFVRIATGNMVNTLTMTANENEELKMTLDLNSKCVVEPATSYEARRAITTERDFVNFGSALPVVATPSVGHFLTPFFFYDGSLSAYGTDYLKITNMTLTINNNLQDKRYVGGYNRSTKYAIPAQRTYELAFTGVVTDSQVFEDLRNEDENNTTSYITLDFRKDNGEQIKLEFKDYYTTANTWPIPDDKGPVTVEWTVMPRTLQSCTVKSHWLLFG